MSIKTINNLPVYQAEIGEDGGCYCVSLVDFPAVEQDFIYFKRDEELIKFAIQDEEQRKVTGVVMRADYPIYRIGTSGYEYYIVFTRETIEEMTLKFLKDGFQNNISIMHNGKLIDGISLLEIYIKDSEKGINPKGFEHIEEGSLMGTYKVESDEVWDLIKSGEVRGFSIEVWSSMTPVEEIDFNKNIKEKENMKTKLQKIKNLISEMLFEFASVTTDKGVIYWDEGEIAVEKEVYVEDETGEKVLAADGEYVLENGTIIKVAEGKVVEIVEPEEEVIEEVVEPEKEENVEVEAEIVEEIVEPEDVVEEIIEDKELEEARAEIERLKAENERLMARIAELEDEIKGLKEEDAADTAEEQFKKQVKNEDRATKLLSLRK